MTGLSRVNAKRNNPFHSLHRTRSPFAEVNWNGGYGKKQGKAMLMPVQRA